MIVPYAHVNALAALDEATAAGVMTLARRAQAVVEDRMRPQGFNLGVDRGGRGRRFADHLHMHVLPRWVGDTNFMPALGDVRVMPQHLDGRPTPCSLGGSPSDPRPRRYLEAYDIRGISPPDEIDEEGGRVRAGAAFVAVTGAKRIALGHDVRLLSSPSMAEAVAEGALGAGADVASSSGSAPPRCSTSPSPTAASTPAPASPPATTRPATPASRWSARGRCRSRAIPASRRSAGSPPTARQLPARPARASATRACWSATSTAT